MMPVSTLAGRKVAVFGLGGSGLATTRALVAGGAVPIVWDDAPGRVEEAASAGLTARDLRGIDWSDISALVLSPGVPLTHPEPHWSVRLALEAGVEVIGDIELFCRERAVRAPGSAFVAITGTNGKSTTTALVAHLLREAGFDVQMGGNIGTAILSLDPPAADRQKRVHVVECSSFQIDLAPSLAPSVGVLLNLTPDHLDRHGTMEHYAEIKERLVLRAELAVIGADDDWCRGIAARREAGGRPTIRIATSLVLSEGLSSIDTRIARARDGRRDFVADLDGLDSLRGAHNAQNACAAFATLSALGVDDATIVRGLESFPGLAHRLELVGRVDRVRFVNDSKATNADAAEKALAAFANIHWIIGGKAKEGGIAPLAPLFGRVTKAYLIGASADAFARTLDGSVPFEHCGTLDVAVERAAADAAGNDGDDPIVLLSPACASYDQFPNFEVRGDRFRALVLSLPGFSPARGA
jgi:UDP-N-acetylmuramoylalanine--D-glutamate ligase